MISFQHVSKRYQLGVGQGSLRDALTGLIRRGHRSGQPGATDREFWALRDVSFAVQPGEVVGLVGANGAGKSTILKLLSKVTHPTSGAIRVDGRVAALIELGAGFHPDLTGRENVYLSGTILGMSRREVEAQMESIVDFAELGPFMDTPVKRYSSGMYVRLGFAVAVHTNPDVLLVDEVLAVGDFAFREKCIQKINEFHAAGKTMVVVAHDRNMLEKLCDRLLLIHRGHLVNDGEPRAILDEYYTGQYDVEGKAPRDDLTGALAASEVTRPVEITRVQIADQHGYPRDRFLTGEPCNITIDFRCNEAVAEPIFYCDIHHEYTWVLGTNNGRVNATSRFDRGESGRVELVCNSLNVLSGAYRVDVGVVSDFFAWRPYHVLKNAASFEVTAAMEHGAGLVHLPHTWRFTHRDDRLGERPEAAFVGGEVGT